MQMRDLVIMLLVGACIAGTLYITSSDESSVAVKIEMKEPEVELKLIELEEEALQDRAIIQLLRQHEYPQYYSFESAKFGNMKFRVDAPGKDGVRKVTIER